MQWGVAQIPPPGPSSLQIDDTYRRQRRTTSSYSLGMRWIPRWEKRSWDASALNKSEEPAPPALSSPPTLHWGRRWRQRFILFGCHMVPRKYEQSATDAEIRAEFSIHTGWCRIFRMKLNLRGPIIGRKKPIFFCVPLKKGHTFLGTISKQADANQKINCLISF